MVTCQTLLAGLHVLSQVDVPEQATLNPVGLAAVVLLGLAMLTVPRRYAVLPMVVMACFVCTSQRVVVFSLNFDVMRLLVLFGVVRILIKEEWRNLRQKPIDVVVLLWAFVGTVAYCLQHATAEALKFKLGVMYDIVGMYGLFRCLIKTWDDVEGLFHGIAVISVPVVLAFLAERTTGRNGFAFFGGVSEITLVRDGRVRCQGAFPHSIMAGCFFASLVPMLFVMWWRRRRIFSWSAVSIAAATGVVVLCASSTPIVGLLAGIMGLGLFCFRSSMGLIRWLAVVALVSLHLLMNAPVWSLLSRVDLAGGSTGWHRYYLVDQAISHFGEWWLIGTTSTAYWGFLLEDVTNQYVLEGIRGGVLSLLLFLAVVGYSFAAVGRMWRTEGSDRKLMAWAMGVCVFVHCVNFIGVSYFGQINMLWYLALAMVASLDPVVVPHGVRANGLRLGVHQLPSSLRPDPR
jgi:hypothetical protein